MDGVLLCSVYVCMYVSCMYVCMYVCIQYICEPLKQNIFYIIYKYSFLRKHILFYMCISMYYVYMYTVHITYILGERRER